MFCPGCGSLILGKKTYCDQCGWGKNDQDDDVELDPIRQKIAPKLINEENPEFPFFPYSPRDVQKEIIRDIRGALSKDEHIVIESGTGTGKTIVSLSAALEHAVERGKKIVYLTRTLSQTDQVMRELRAINNIRKVSGIALSGRGRSCPYLKTLNNHEKISPSVLANLCEESKKKANSGHGGCKFYSMTKLHLAEIEDYCINSTPTSDDFDSFCESMSACPYEAKKMIMKDVTVIAMPYIRILSQDIRDNFLGSIESDGSNLIAIVDEAHNIIDAAREQESFTISEILINGAADEAQTFKNEQMIYDDIPLSLFIGEIRNSLKSFANDKLTLTTRESLMDEYALEERICKRFEMSKIELETAIERMNVLGQERTEELIERGENKVSELLTLSEHLKSWLMSDPDKYVKTVRADDNGEAFHAACIDPHDVTYFLRNLKGAIHMSGTLQPLDQYVRMMELPSDTATRIYPTPFPAENKLVLYVKDVTSKYDELKRDPSMPTRIRRNIIKLCNAVNKNTLVFFTSYRMMQDARPYLERDIKNKTLYWEESGKQGKTMAALNQFRKGKNGVFFTVMGGSIAEGIDFPGEELCFAIIVGMPFSPPSLELKAMEDKVNKKFGGNGIGWRYTSLIPTERKMLQAIGRLIRTDTDRGAAVILDYRAGRYKELGARATDDPLGEVTRFFEAQ